MDNVKKYDQAFVETFSIKKKLLNNLEYNKIEQWDSIGHMTLIGNLEEVFDISMDMEDIIDFSSYMKGMILLAKYGVKFE